MNIKDTGIRNFRNRIDFTIRHSVLSAVWRPDSLASAISDQNVALMAALPVDQQAAFANVMARAVDIGIKGFLDGLDDEPDGFEVRYGRELLNDGSGSLADENIPLSPSSQFNQDGSPNVKI
jgi:hypothetical protein